MSIEPSTAIVVGHLVGVFGIKGWLKVRSFTQPAENILDYQPWRLKLVAGSTLVEVDAYELRPQGLVVHLKGVDDRDIAAQLGRAEIEVEKAKLPVLQDGDYYWHELIGLSVVTKYAGEPIELGVVIDILETGANDVLVVSPAEGSLDNRERLVPYVPGVYVTKVDQETRQICVMWDPEF